MSAQLKPGGTSWPARIGIVAVLAVLGVIAFGSYRISGQIDATMRKLGVVPPTSAEVAAKAAKD